MSGHGELARLKHVNPGEGDYIMDAINADQAREGGRASAVRALLAAVAVGAALTNAVSAAGQPIPSNSEHSKGTTMFTVTFGEHSKILAQPSEQGAIRKFFRDVLGAPQTRETERSDIFRLGPHFFLGVIYDKDAPTEEAMRKSIWLELAATDPVATKARILAGGGKEIEFWDKRHFYFQAPGGQVFRLISDAEDMSEYQR
jgi:hypothetical protein